MELTLYTYWRSSAAYRVRIALNLKGVAHRLVPVNIAPGQDEQRGAAYLAINPQGRVPAIATPQGIAGQSMAILEWLDEVYPEPPLLPRDPFERLKVRAFADTIACDIHPLNNLSVLSRLRTQFGADEDAVNAWYRDWIARGFAVLEPEIAALTTPFLGGEAPGLAEITLVPQMANARRFKVDLTPFPALVALDVRACALPAFAAAAPEVQPDAPKP
jgi:maleylpyruvate isomerase